MAKRYFTLAEFTNNNRWTPEFGDYDRENVRSEMEDRRDHDVKAKHLKIIVSGDTQADIDAAIARLNAKVPAAPNFEQAILCAADGIEFLRKCDIYRVLSEYTGDRAALAAWIKEQCHANQYIVDEVNTVMIEEFSS